MKKFIAILILIIIFIAGIFVFANKKTKDNKKHLVFMTLQMGTFSSYVNSVISDFEKIHPDVKITWIDVPYSEGEKRALASMLGNNPPDLINLTPDFSILLAQRNALLKIDKSYMKDFVPAIADSMKYNDEYYAFPFYATSALTFYNSELLAKAKMAGVPEDYIELYKEAEKFKKSTGKYLTMPNLTENDTVLKILNKYNVNSPETIVSEKSEYIYNMYKYMYEKDLIPKESITQGHRESLEKYMSGEVAVLPAGSNFLNIIKENAPEVFSKTKVAKQLVGSTGKYDVSLMNLIIPVKANYPDEAIEFALFLTNKDNQIKLAKLTSIIPVNRYAIQDSYFNSQSQEIFAHSRALSAEQLNNLQSIDYHTKKQKELFSLANNYIQQIVLNKAETTKLLNDFAQDWKKTQL